MNNDQITKLYEAQHNFLGYPCNMAYDYKELYPYFFFHFNNIGNPNDIDSMYRVNTKDIECNVLTFFSDVWNFNEETWGYITANGTEGNLQAFYIARKLYPNGVAYTSSETHYSIKKICHILNIKLEIINCTETGEIDYKHFEECLERNKEFSAIINCNFGTTMLGATDNPHKLYKILCKHNKENDYYMHADSALMGVVLPFLDKDLFYKKYFHSISISGHKFLGVPFPCGIFMMEKRLINQCSHEHINVINSTDCTISGSRNGHSALFMDYIIKKKGKVGFQNDVEKCLGNSEYLIKQMSYVGKNAWRNHNSLTVVFDIPDEPIVKKWQLACSHPYAHAIVLPHVNRHKINRFVKDIKFDFKRIK